MRFSIPKIAQSRNRVVRKYRKPTCKLTISTNKQKLKTVFLLERYFFLMLKRQNFEKILQKHLKEPVIIYFDYKFKIC